MGTYRPAEAIVLLCERQNSFIYTTVEIEPFDDKSVLTRSPRAPASLILREEKKVAWHFDFHKALSINERKISFVTFTDSVDLPIVGNRYVFQSWWTPEQLDVAQSNPQDWQRKRFISPKPDWNHEHCIICAERLSEYEDEQHFGYVRLNSRHREDWLCESCYNKYLVSGFGNKLGDDIGNITQMG